MFWDDLMRRWRRDNRALDPRLMRAAAGNVAVLPSPRPRRRSRLPWVLLVALLVAAAAVLLQQVPVEAVVRPG
jgi:hypothetical protein